MNVQRDSGLECPRCRLGATPVAGRRGLCSNCGAELVPANGPSEQWIRAYLYGDRDGLRVRALESSKAVAR